MTAGLQNDLNFLSECLETVDVFIVFQELHTKFALITTRRLSLLTS